MHAGFAVRVTESGAAAVAAALVLLEQESITMTALMMVTMTLKTAKKLRQQG